MKVQAYVMQSDAQRRSSSFSERADIRKVVSSFNISNMHPGGGGYRPNCGRNVNYPNWRLSLFSLVPPDKCQDDELQCKSF